MVDSSHWVLPLPADFIVSTETVLSQASYVDLDDLRVCGRRSFQNFNPGVEKLSPDTTDPPNAEEIDEEDQNNTVTAKEMADIFQHNAQRRTQSVDNAIDAVNEKSDEDQPQSRRVGKRFYTEAVRARFKKPTKAAKRST